MEAAMHSDFLSSVFKSSYLFTYDWGIVLKSFWVWLSCLPEIVK